MKITKGKQQKITYEDILVVDNTSLDLNKLSETLILDTEVPVFFTKFDILQDLAIITDSEFKILKDSDNNLFYLSDGLSSSWNCALDFVTDLMIYCTTKLPTHRSSVDVTPLFKTSSIKDLDLILRIMKDSIKEPIDSKWAVVSFEGLEFDQGLNCITPTLFSKFRDFEEDVMKFILKKQSEKLIRITDFTRSMGETFVTFSGNAGLLKEFFDAVVEMRKREDDKPVNYGLEVSNGTYSRSIG